MAIIEFYSTVRRHETWVFMGLVLVQITQQGFYWTVVQPSEKYTKWPSCVRIGTPLVQDCHENLFMTSISLAENYHSLLTSDVTRYS